MADTIVVCKPELVETIARYNELVKKANEGDRQAEKILRFGERYGSGYSKMRPYNG